MKMISGLLFILSGVAAWLFWGPVLRFGFSLIPSTAEYAWAGKIVVTVLVAWFGGIAVPLVLLFLAVGTLLKSAK